MTAETFGCDWPINGVACGKPAQWFIEVDGVHRPLCDECTGYAARIAEASNTPLHFEPIDGVDAERIPKKIPTQAERMGIGYPPPPKTSPSIPPALDPEPRPSRPPLRQALADLAGALLEEAQKGVERWRRNG